MKLNQKGDFEILVGCIILVIILAAGVVLAGGYFGLIPPVAKILKSDRPRDLGIKYQKIEYARLNKKYGIAIETTKDPSKISDPLGRVYEGSFSTKQNLTQEDLSAVANSPYKYYPFSDIQIKINTDGTVETSAMLRIDRAISFANSLGFTTEEVKKAMSEYKIPMSNIPAYAKAGLSVTNNKVDLTVHSLELGRIPVPQSIVNNATPQIEEVTESILKSLPGVYVRSIKFENGLCKFDGNVPEKRIILTE